MVQRTGTKNRRGTWFCKASLKTAINHLTENCYFDSGIPMGIDLTQF